MKTEDFNEDQSLYAAGDNEIEKTDDKNDNPKETCIICSAKMDPEKSRTLGDKAR